MLSIRSGPERSGWSMSSKTAEAVIKMMMTHQDISAMAEGRTCKPLKMSKIEAYSTRSKSNGCMSAKCLPYGVRIELKMELRERVPQAYQRVHPEAIGDNWILECRELANQGSTIPIVVV